MGPVNFTPNMALQQFLAQLLGFDMSSLMGMQAGQGITAWLKNLVIPGLLGISPTSSLWNMSLYTNMTDYGIMMQNMNSAANMAGIQQMMQLQNSNRYNLYEGWQKMVMSKAAFNDLPDAQKAQYNNNYDAYIQHKAQGMMDNQALNTFMLLTGWDPTGAARAAFNVREAASNIARNAMWRGDDKAMQKAEAISRLFLDKDDKIAYSKWEFGGMTLNETSALAAMLTKGISLGGTDTDSIAKAIEELRTRLQNLTKAMSPLKDLFGDDVPKMVEFLEDITGKSIKQLDEGTIAKLSANVVNGITTGAFTQEQMAKLTVQLQGNIGQMNLPFYLENGAMMMSDRILTTVNAGNIPLMMSRASYQTAVSERTIRQAASPFANNVNLAYALWEADKRRRNENFDVKEGTALFQAEYEALRASGRFNEEQALLRLSGASSLQQMAVMGTRFGGYNRAVSAGLGMDMASTEGVRRRAATIIMGEDTPEKRIAMQRVINMFMSGNGPEGKKNMTVDDLDRYFQGLENASGSDQLLYQAYMELNQNRRLMAFNVDMRKSAEQRDDAQKRQIADGMRKRANQMTEWLGRASEKDSSLGETLVNWLRGDKTFKDKAALAEVQEFMSSKNFDPQDIAAFKAIAEANGDDKAQTLRHIQAYIANNKTNPDRNARLASIWESLEPGDDRNTKYAALSRLSGSALGLLVTWDKDEKKYIDKTDWKDALAGSPDANTLQRRLKEQALKNATNASDDAYKIKARENTVIDLLGKGGEQKFKSIRDALVLDEKTINQVMKSDSSLKDLRGDEKHEMERALRGYVESVSGLGLNDSNGETMSPEQIMAKAFGAGGIFQEVDNTLSDLGDAINDLIGWLKKVAEPGNFSMLSFLGFKKKEE